ncbi:hypothetical protein BDZ94DRAFT_1281002 [Collybia nuda]|uniref:Methyltransferase type 11 domain-containing protein n=1 Tax=Collybia nuda TaxID=64659 RepID=A0A9P5YA19_9AGAR|nr:hypothetical protein BDZ94DRAFT_1281002 [Collybia nuda]
MAPQVQATSIDGEPQVYEEKNVHAIYDEIAPHFSSTRYKPWPIIAAFISSLPIGWIGLDSGTGNGKYLPLPFDRPGAICTIGLDRSRNLLNIAKNAGNTGKIRDVVLGDILGRGWRVAAFDYAISIATIHHLATHERRKTAVKRLIEAVSPNHGRVLIYVWAIEQDALSKRTIPVDGATGTRGQDVVVPWVLSRQDKGSQASTEPQVLNRYYHMFAKGELSGLVQDAASELGLQLGPPLGLGEAPISISRGVEMVQDGWERSNYYVELRCWELP